MRILGYLFGLCFGLSTWYTTDYGHEVSFDGTPPSGVSEVFERHHAADAPTVTQSKNQLPSEWMTNLHGSALRGIQSTDPYATPAPIETHSHYRSDPNGNLVYDDEYFYQYDAWNRLVQVNKRGTVEWYRFPYEQFYPHPSMVFGHKTLAIDRLDAPALSWDNGVGSIFETRRLVPGAKLIAYARNRTLDIANGRWLQQDPNASGISTLRSAMHGAAPIVSAILVQLEERIADGLSLFEYGGSEVIQRRDPLGLYSGDEFVEDLFGASFSLPTPGDFIRGALSGMVSEYASRQTWDVEWASDFNLGDNEHSRTENLWVTVALMRGLRDCFEIGFGDYKINLLDGFDMASVGGGGARTPKSRIHSPRGVAGYARTVSVNGFHASVYSRPGGGRSYVLFDDKAVRANVRVNVTTRAQERIDANKAAGLSKAPTGWVWHHHSTKRGIMQLVPEKLHEKVGHLGRADW
ncbi:MAG: HNH endonuclease [Phycisphaeraceae bacterium]|nr:HNH endonuclease [Phycisphaeraceae bacterium]